MSIEVSNEILRQLGGRMFKMMTGAKNFTGSEKENFLSFRLPGNGFSKFNYVKITLTPMDEYEIEFGNVRGSEYKMCEVIEGVWRETLVEVIERKTGLSLSMPRIITKQEVCSERAEAV